jgi:hypothetical protein
MLKPITMTPKSKAYMSKVIKDNYKASNGKSYKLSKKDKALQKKIDKLKDKWVNQKTTIDFLNS